MLFTAYRDFLRHQPTRLMLDGLLSLCFRCGYRRNGSTLKGYYLGRQQLSRQCRLVFMVLPCLARNAGSRYSAIATQNTDCPFCHLFDYRLANCTELFQICFGDAQHLMLHLVAIGDNAPFEIGGTSRMRGDNVGNPATRAALRRAHRQMLL